MFAKHAAGGNSSFMAGAVNAETNAGRHDFGRAMSEARDLNDWFNADFVTTEPAKARLHFRASSFCMGAANDFHAWDQAISFFLPNGTWLQPPGYIHQMIDQVRCSSAGRLAHLLVRLLAHLLARLLAYLLARLLAHLLALLLLADLAAVRAGHHAGQGHDVVLGPEERRRQDRRAALRQRPAGKHHRDLHALLGQALAR